MIYPSADKIEEQISSKYALVILAAKRAKLIKEGARPLIATDSTNPITVALEEIAAGKLTYQFDENSLAGREAIADQQAVIGKRDLEVDGIPLPDETDLLIASARDALGGDLLDEETEELLGVGMEDDLEIEEEEEEDNPLLSDEESEASEV